MTMFRHLTWSGRCAVVYYWVRARFVAPAPARDRCPMGAPVDPSVHCPRSAPPGQLWCRQHVPRISSRWRGRSAPPDDLNGETP